MANKWDTTDSGKTYHTDYNKEYDKKNLCIRVNIRKDSGILEVLDEACLVNNVSRCRISPSCSRRASGSGGV